MPTPGRASARPCSRRSSPRQSIACRVETASIHISGGATSSNLRNLSKPTGFAAAAAATLASMTSFNARAAKARRPRPSSARGCPPCDPRTRSAGTAAKWQPCHYRPESTANRRHRAKRSCRPPMPQSCIPMPIPPLRLHRAGRLRSERSQVRILPGALRTSRQRSPSSPSRCAAGAAGRPTEAGRSARAACCGRCDRRACR